VVGRTTTGWLVTCDVSKSTALIFARAEGCFIKPRPVKPFGEPTQWVYTTRYLGVTLDIRLTRSPHIDQVRKKTTQTLGMLGPLLNRRSDLSIRNEVPLYKQLMLPMMDYACPAKRFAARTHVWRLQVLKSKCLRFPSGAAWFVGGRQIHENRGVP